MHRNIAHLKIAERAEPLENQISTDLLTSTVNIKFFAGIRRKIVFRGLFHRLFRVIHHPEACKANCRSRLVPAR